MSEHSDLETTIKQQVAFAHTQLGTLLNAEMKLSARQVKATIASAQEALKQATAAASEIGKKK